ncbi:MAG: alpha/beta fold hydrolase [Chloroflexota bacterium]|nr:alpha/beta fold hydrolase [Chloroflexota bacterium]
MNSSGDTSLPVHHLPEQTHSRHVIFAGFQYGDEDAPLLEAHVSVPQDGMPHAAVVLCHANPAAGGSMEMKIVVGIEQALAGAGFATLRYNSRGVGASTGTVSRNHGKVLVAPEGEPETEDIGTALAFLGMQEGVDNRRMALVGHSFGARISLAYLAAHPEAGLGAVVCIGLPVAWRDLRYLGQWPHPKLFVTGERDDFCPPNKLAEYAATLPEPKTVVTLRDTGHFFEEREANLAALVTEFLKKVLEANR